MGSSDASHRSPTAPPLTDLLAALSQPACYPHHPAHVEVVQTHISVVFLAGEAVYKLKKPVRFSFLDYSTLALRHHCCQEEVRLNRRLAPTVYLGVVPVTVWGQFADGFPFYGADRATVVARVSLDMLRARESRREEALDPIANRAGGHNPEEETLLGDLMLSRSWGTRTNRHSE